MTDNSKAFLLLVALVLLPLVLYAPGLHSPFLLDDKPNLSAMSQADGVDSLDRIVKFVLGGIASSLGRPLSLLSFAMHDTHWPTDPWPMKYTNLLIHVLNGLLLFWLVFRISRYFSERQEQRLVAAFSISLIWLVHPLNVSTVLYTIQRMTELSALFTLTGLLAYVHGREICLRPDGASKTEYIISSMAVCASLLLGILSKENAILLVLYMLVLELFVLQPASKQQHPHWRYWLVLFIATPLVLLTVYLVARIPAYSEAYILRDFGLYERLLTEARVLISYLREILLPNLSGNGVYHDDYVISRSLFSPPTTLVCIILIAGMVILAWYKRKQFPLFAFAVFWFLCGHLLESTFLPLEIYFEHRNYLPMLGPLVLAIFAANKLLAKRFCTPVFMTVIVMLCGITYMSAVQWGNRGLLTLISAQEHPDSLHLNQELSNYLLETGQRNQSIAVLENYLANHEDIMSFRLHVIALSCQAGSLDQAFIQKTLEVAPQAGFQNGFNHALFQLFEKIMTGKCSQLEPEFLMKLVDQLLANPRYRIKQIVLRDLYFIRGNLLLREGKFGEAMAAFDQAVAVKASIPILYNQASLLATAGLFDSALEKLDKAESLEKDKYYLMIDKQILSDINALKGKIRMEMQDNMEPGKGDLMRWN